MFAPGGKLPYRRGFSVASRSQFPTEGVEVVNGEEQEDFPALAVQSPNSSRRHDSQPRSARGYLDPSSNAPSRPEISERRGRTSVQKGVVSRLECSEDRRIRTVSLTEKGRQMFIPLFRQHTALIKRAFQDVSSEEL